METILNLVDQRVTEWMLREKAAREGERKPNLLLNPDRAIITISRQYGACGHTIAELVARELGPDWEIWDQQIVDAIAKHANVVSEMVEILDEHTISSQEQAIRYLTRYWGLNPDSYFRHLVQVLLSLSHQGKKIIIGRGANFVLPQALSVRLQASLAYRTAWAREREGIAEEEAKRKIRKLDRERADFIKSRFNQNVDDPAMYDIVFQVHRLGMEGVTSAIAAAMECVCSSETVRLAA
jgi:cytidylate kinase